MVSHLIRCIAIIVFDNSKCLHKTSENLLKVPCLYIYIYTNNLLKLKSSCMNISCIKWPVIINQSECTFELTVKYYESSSSAHIYTFWLNWTAWNRNVFDNYAEYLHLNCVLMLNWIVWNGTVFDFKRYLY